MFEAVFETCAASMIGGFLCALASCIVLVLTSAYHGALTMDGLTGVQKVHHDPTPRVGGVGIYLGLALAWDLLPEGPAKRMLGAVLVAGLPALGCGLLEDVTKAVGVRTRLLGTIASGVLVCLITGVAVNRLDVPGLDGLLALTPIAVFFTAFAVGGVANAVNIIDGFHGLASGTAMIALAAFAAIAARVGDLQMVMACIVVAAVIAGFWLVNYPWGKLFLGDGGAYFVGFALAWLAVQLPVRNQGVSPWASMLVCAYPVIEVLYSVARRWVRRQSPGAPDCQHLHSLIKTEVVRKKLHWASVGVRNAAVSPILWCFASVPGLLAAGFFDQPALLAALLVGCVALYHAAYTVLTPAYADAGVLGVTARAENT